MSGIKSTPEGSTPKPTKGPFDASEITNLPPVDDIKKLKNTLERKEEAPSRTSEEAPPKKEEGPLDTFSKLESKQFESKPKETSEKKPFDKEEGMAKKEQPSSTKTEIKTGDEKKELTPNKKIIRDKPSTQTGPKTQAEVKPETKKESTLSKEVPSEKPSAEGRQKLQPEVKSEEKKETQPFTKEIVSDMFPKKVSPKGPEKTPFDAKTDIKLPLKPETKDAKPTETKGLPNSGKEVPSTFEKPSGEKKVLAQPEIKPEAKKEIKEAIPKEVLPSTDREIPRKDMGQPVVAKTKVDQEGIKTKQPQAKPESKESLAKEGVPSESRVPNAPPSEKKEVTSKPQEQQHSEVKPSLTQEQITKSEKSKDLDGKEVSTETIQQLEGLPGQSLTIGPLGQSVQVESAQQPSGVKAQEMAELVSTMADRIWVSDEKLSAKQEVRMTLSKENPVLEGTEVIITKTGENSLQIQFAAHNDRAEQYIFQNKEFLNNNLNEKTNFKDIHIDITRTESSNQGEDQRDRETRGEYIPAPEDEEKK